MNIQKALVIDDEPLMRDFVGETLTRMGCEVKYASDGVSAIRQIDEDFFDIIFTDMKLPKLSGLDVLVRAKEISPLSEVVLMTAYGTIETAVSAMQKGACDYLLKPFTAEQVELLVEKVSEKISLKAENAYLTNELMESLGFGEIVGKSLEVKAIYEMIKKVAVSKANVLISGESGTGKELIARAIHYNSDRKNKPFIKLNCAALPSNLIESELFGHEKGAFTGALNQRLGRFELADKGTIFLDEISELDISLQSKLLRVLQEREFEKIGSAKTVKVDVRVLASTNRNLKEEIKKGNFREDLFYRLNVIPINLPPLRDRKSDIPLLANHFLARYVLENKKTAKTISKNALDYLMHYEWPGNIRELENVIERAVVMDRGNIIECEDLGGSFFVNESYNKEENGINLNNFYIVGKTINEIEKKYILETLMTYENNRTKTADVLGISIRTLRNKLNEYKLE